MEKKITATTGSFGLGHPPGTKLFKVPSGEYAGRMLALMQTAAAELAYAYADAPYTSWSSPVTIAADSADLPFDGVMDGDGNVHLVYSEQTTEYLVSRKLTFTGGVWNVGSKVTVYNGGISRYPSLTRESGGTLWVSWTRVNGSLHYVHAKSSTDGGTTWGGGASDSGEQLTSGGSSAYSKILIRQTNVSVVYTNGGLNLSHRSRPLSGGSWTAEETIVDSTGLDFHFDAACASNGILGVVFDDGELKYREHDGTSWGSLVTLDADGGDSPQLLFNDSVPAVVYLSSLASEQNLFKYTTRESGSFSTPEELDSAAKQFDAVLLYHATTATYADLTTAAGDASTADVYHPDSNALARDSHDVVYLGMEHPFRHITWRLSTAGSGGTVVYSYWDGTNWQAFTPAGGNYHLDATEKQLLLWEDDAALPNDWQKKTIDGKTLFWVKVEVDTAFGTAPVGSRITACTNRKAVSLRR